MTIRLGRSFAATLFALASIFIASNICAHGTSHPPVISAEEVPAALAVRSALGKPARGIEDLKFQDMFRLPVGPMGIEASDRMKRLDGQRVRLVGFMVRSVEPRMSSFILSPMPVGISEEDEAEADELPFNAVLVTLPQTLDSPIPNLAGLVQVSGVLRVASVNDRDSPRIFPVSLELERTGSRSIEKISRRLANADAKARPVSR